MLCSSSNAMSMLFDFNIFLLQLCTNRRNKDRDTKEEIDKQIYKKETKERNIYKRNKINKNK